jgi:hypothetical protein
MANITLTNGFRFTSGDTNYRTQLVAVSNRQVWYESPSGTMIELAAARDLLARNVPIVCIPAFQKVFLSDGISATKYYVDFSTATPSWNTWSATSGKGDISALKSNIGCLYRGRIVLNDVTNPHAWYMSRQADPFDWLFVQDDSQSAVAASNAPVGEIGDILTAFIPYQDDYLAMGCAHSVWFLRGDPAAGGQLNVVLKTDGIFGPKAFCFDAAGVLYFMGTGGMYKMAPGSIPEPLTATRIPKLLDNISRETHRITMGFDRQNHGIIVSILQLSDYTATNYWYDLRTDGFGPEEYATGTNPTAIHYYDSSVSSLSKLIIGGSDGYLRHFDPEVKSDVLADDSNAAIDSYVVLGPLQLGGPIGKAKIQNMVLTTGMGTAAAGDTDEMDYAVHIGKGVQETIKAIRDAQTPAFSGTVQGGGRQSDIRKRATGNSIAIKIGNNAAEKSWAIESVAIEAISAGRNRA